MVCLLIREEQSFSYNLEGIHTHVYWYLPNLNLSSWVFVGAGALGLASVPVNLLPNHQGLNSHSLCPVLAVWPWTNKTSLKQSFLTKGRKKVDNDNVYLKAFGVNYMRWFKPITHYYLIELVLEEFRIWGKGKWYL